MIKISDKQGEMLDSILKEEATKLVCPDCGEYENLEVNILVTYGFNGEILIEIDDNHHGAGPEDFYCTIKCTECGTDLEYKDLITREEFLKREEATRLDCREQDQFVADIKEYRKAEIVSNVMLITKK